MASPYFYFDHLATMPDEFVLNENSSRHVVQVLRMQPGAELRLTNGLGMLVQASVVEAVKKRCLVRILDKKLIETPRRRVKIALSFLKNASRFEWFLEKATELGISDIFPLKTSRTEKEQIRPERLKSIIESALIQSQQVWMPVIHDLQQFSQWVTRVQADQKFIAHCAEGTKTRLSEMVNTNLSSQLILIGPEGDFTEQEIRLALDNHFIAVELGENRLRSETAALAAASMLKLL